MNERVTIKYNDGTVALVDIDTIETPSRKQIDEWMAIYEVSYGLARQKGARAPNFPEYITEALACIHYNAIRFIPKAGNVKGGDLYNRTTHTINEVKGGMGCGPASFSPRIFADRILYVRVNPAAWEYDIFNLDYSKIKDVQINKEQTFADQQNEGKRPRFDLNKYVVDNAIVAEHTGKIYTSTPEIGDIIKNFPMYNRLCDTDYLKLIVSLVKEIDVRNNSNIVHP